MGFSFVSQKTRMWFDKELKDYDRQLWEQTVEKGISEKIKNLKSKRIVDDIMKNSIKRQMIDVDLITGTTFCNKSNRSFLSCLIKGIRNSLFPLYNSKWWISKIGFPSFLILLIFYTINLVLLFKNVFTSNDLVEVKATENITSNFCVFTILSVVLSLIFDKNFDNIGNNQVQNDCSFYEKTAIKPKISFVPELNSDSTDEKNTSDFTSKLKSTNMRNKLMVSEIESAESESGSGPEFNNEENFNDEEESNLAKEEAVYSSNNPKVIQPVVERIGCLIKQNGITTKEYLTANEIGSIIVLKTNSSPEDIAYVVFAFCASWLISLINPIYNYSMIDFGEKGTVNWTINGIFGNSVLEKCLTFNFVLQKFFLNFHITFLLTIAERSCRQRLKYYRHFDMLTSLRRSQKKGLPYFRLNSVRKVKLWLSLRSYIKKCGPIRSVQTIITFSFYFFIALFVAFGYQIYSLKYEFFYSPFSWEICCYLLVFGIYLLRFITDQTYYNKAVRNGNILLTEKFNLYQSIDEKPAKKERYLLTVKALEVAFEIIKNVEKTFKLSSVFGNPILFSLLHVFLLSTLTALLNEILGFKLKFFKIKI